ncbi:MAG: amidohydrolase family protein [Chitinophagaceae bacterium]|nr:amidohydrolase family protein [Chitinophagaceae bacterium]
MKLVFLSIFLLLATAIKAQNAIDNRQQEIVFHSVSIIPMDKERVIENQTVVVKNGKITAIGDQAKIKYGQNALVIDAKGKYLIPGLAEMHAHVPPVDNIEPMQEVVLLFALKGVTTIRGMLGHPLHLELRSKLQRDEIIGPRFYTSGPSFSGNTVKTAEGGAEMVRGQKQAGYDFLKLHPGLTKETFAAIAKTAKEVNIPFAGHVSYDVGVWTAIDAGYATIDHLDGFVESLVPGIENISEQQNGLFAMFSSSKADTSRIQKLMTALREKNIWVVPTQALAERWFAPGKDPEALKNEPEMIYMAPTTVTGWVNTKKNLMNNANYNAEAINRFITLRRKLIYECNKNGVGLLLGSDAPQVFDVPGFSIHHELQYMVDAGLTPYEALRTGTVNVAAFYKRSNDMGVIKTGAVSDLVLLNGNPLKDISQTKNIEGVMVGNHWLSKIYIGNELKKLEKH